MSVSDTALAANLNTLGVNSASAFNTPMSGTPIPTSTLSNETTSLLDEVATRLKEPSSKKGRGLKRKRQQSPATSPDSRGNYPAATKPLYLKAKTLYRKKLNLATNIHSVKNSLKSGNFPVQCNFKCSPPVSADEVFKQKWTEATAKCKRDITLLWVEEMNQKYSNIKLEIQSTLSEIEGHLTQEQFKEIQDSLSSKYKTSAPAQLEKKLRADHTRKSTQTTGSKRGRNSRPQQNQDKQLKMLLSGLTKLIQNKK